MANFKFFNIGKANEEITRLELANTAQAEEITKLKAAGVDAGNNAEIAAEAERLTGVNATLTGENTKLASEVAKLKTDLSASQTEATNAKNELATEKSTFETRAQKRVADALAAAGHPQKPAAGDPNDKPADKATSGYDRVKAACAEQFKKATGN